MFLLLCPKCFLLMVAVVLLHVVVDVVVVVLFLHSVGLILLLSL